MKISVITCTWNSAAWLAESIASVSAQVHPSIERVFVDGGSTDGTLDMIAAVPGDVKVLHNVRGGITRAMNEGARAATGEVIAHLHSDDVYCGANVLSTVAARLEQSRAVWLYGRCKSLIDGRQFENEHAPIRYSYAALVRRNFIPHPSTFVRRAAFEAVGGFDPQWKYAMDYDMWLKLGRMGDPIEIPDYLAAFRYHAGSFSTRNAWAAHNETLSIRLKYAGRNPMVLAEHVLRHGVRSLRMLRQPPPYAGSTAEA